MTIGINKFSLSFINPNSRKQVSFGNAEDKTINVYGDDYKDGYRILRK